MISAAGIVDGSMPRKRRFRWLRWGFALVFLAGLFLAYGSTWPDDPRQDRCEFGLVPNARYQEFLSIALEKIEGGEWAPIKIWPWTPSAEYRHLYAETAQVFRLRVEELLALATTDNERVAAIHAAMRAMGGRYEPRAGHPTKYDFAVAQEFQHVIGYRFDNRKLGNYFPVARWNGVNIWVTKTSPVTVTDVTFGGVAGWAGPPFALHNVIGLGPPPPGLCPPPHRQNTTSTRSRP